MSSGFVNPITIKDAIEKFCGANWQLLMNKNNVGGFLKCRICGVYVTDGGTPKCLKDENS